MNIEIQSAAENLKQPTNLPRFAFSIMDNRLYVSIHKNEMHKARRDLSKLVKKVIIDKNGHHKTVYVKLGLPVKKDSRLAAEKDSTKQAHELTLDMFGTLEEVKEMAIMDWEAETRDGARSILVKFVDKPLKSKAGVEATVSKNSIEKILSGKSVDKSYDAKAHFLAAVNIEKLFSNAIEPFIFPAIPQKHNENYQEVKRLYAPMAFQGRIIPVKFTIMIMLNEKEGKRIYSIEAIDADIDKK